MLFLFFSHFSDVFIHVTCKLFFVNLYCSLILLPLTDVVMFQFFLPSLHKLFFVFLDSIITVA